MSTFTTRAFTYARRGPINSVLKLNKVEVTATADEVVVQTLQAPLHRTDAAVINGTALGKAKPIAGAFAIGGSEGVGKVVSAGTSQTVKAGDTVWVSPINGCWSEKVAVKPNAVFKIDPAHVELATFASSLLTAQRLTSAVKKGDVVVQNGGSGLVSLAVSAFAQKKGATVLTAASAGDRFAEAAKRHKAFGSEVFETSPAGARKMAEATKGKKVSTFLNGGGKYFNDFSKVVSDQGTVITYGAGTGRSLTYAAAPMIYRSITLSTFYLPTYLSSLTVEQRQSLLDETLKAMSDSKLSYPVTVAKGLDAFVDVWDSTFVKGGSKGILKF